ARVPAEGAAPTDKATKSARTGKPLNHAHGSIDGGTRASPLRGGSSDECLHHFDLSLIRVSCIMMGNGKTRRSTACPLPQRAWSPREDQAAQVAGWIVLQR